MEFSKKRIILIVLNFCVAIVCFVSGYFANRIHEAASTLVTAASNAIEMPDADEYPEVEWPTYGFATKLPTPDWSNNGEIFSNLEAYTRFVVGYTTLDDFENYTEACKKLGYTITGDSSDDVKGYRYYAENDKGYGVLLQYEQMYCELFVTARADTDNWSKSWRD